VTGTAQVRERAATADLTMQELQLEMLRALGVAETPDVDAPAPSAPCPFPETNLDGGKLLQWGGAPGKRWARYSVRCEPQACGFCDKMVEDREHAVAAVHPVGDSCEVRWVHRTCAAAASGGFIRSMATHPISRDLPDCALCGQPHGDHRSDLTSIYEVMCDTEHEQFWRPSTPFQSKNWPYRTVIDSPKYTPDGRVAYADAEAA
jgi:hypothetical protein